MSSMAISDDHGPRSYLIGMMEWICGGFADFRSRIPIVQIRDSTKREMFRMMEIEIKAKKQNKF